MRVKMLLVLTSLIFTVPLVLTAQQTKKGDKKPAEVKQTNVIVTPAPEVKDPVPKETDAASAPAAQPNEPFLSKMNIYATYGAGSMVNLAFYYRFNPAIRFGLGLGYTPEDAGNSGINVMLSGIIDVIRLNAGFMTIDLSVVDNILFFSDSMAIYSGIGPAVYLQFNDLPILGIGVVNQFYFRDSGPVYQLGISLGLNL
ncbi:MAG: hypothetical protein A2Y33_06405 [Spirochaetes bacterium GWF1_51_8]|nr:MAG: hypothetical protein A2Y33_06405 [Spirochaetes bacterium GWF1_51_8]